jgi:hypothetical protein
MLAGGKKAEPVVTNGNRSLDQRNVSAYQARVAGQRIAGSMLRWL